MSAGLGGTQFDCDVVIVTAADGEDLAVRAVEDGAVGDWREEPLPGHSLSVWRRTYRAANGRHLRVVLAKALEMGGDAASNLATTLVNRFQPSCLAMCGICAGRPGWTNLGDVIVAKRVYRYDSGARIVIDGVKEFQPDITTYQLDPTWTRQAETYNLAVHESALGPRPKLRQDQECWVLGQLLDGHDPLQHPDRKTICPNWFEVIEALANAGEVSPDDLQLTDAGKKRIRTWRNKYPDGAPVLGLPKVHVGVLGTGNALQRDDAIFDKLADHQRLIYGLDMEASAVGVVGFLQKVPYTIVVKAVMDFAEPGRGYQYRTYAAHLSVPETPLSRRSLTTAASRFI
jgi:nucleoside phosphorylase